jgi:predicted class III extradiol MEMO1 family dioxygenase
MDAVETGVHAKFLGVLEETENTVCGRHPIGVVMAAVEVLEKGGYGEDGSGKGRFRFVRYERSSDCVSVRDSSVSYCSAFAVF